MFSLSIVRYSKLGPSKGRGPLRDKRFFDLERPFYKGFGAVGLGRHTKTAHFIVCPELVPMYKVPDLKNFELSPYVSRRVPVMTNAKGWWPQTQKTFIRRSPSQPKYNSWI